MVFNFRYYNHIQSISTIPDQTYNIRTEFPLRPGRGRIFKDYNETVIKIYEELKNQLHSWNLKKDYDTVLSTWSFWYIYACIKRKIASNEQYDFVRHQPYKSIINKARPKLWTQKIARALLISRSYKVLKSFVKLIEKTK